MDGIIVSAFRDDNAVALLLQNDHGMGIMIDPQDIADPDLVKAVVFNNAAQGVLAEGGIAHFVCKGNTAVSGIGGMGILLHADNVLPHIRAAGIIPVGSLRIIRLLGNQPAVHFRFGNVGTGAGDQADGQQQGDEKHRQFSQTSAHRNPSFMIE